MTFEGLTGQRTREAFGCARCGIVTPRPGDDEPATEYLEVPEGVEVGATKVDLAIAITETSPKKGAATATRGRVGWCVTCGSALVDGLR